MPQLQFIDEWWLLQLKLWCRLEIYGAVLMVVDLHVVVQMILRKVFSQDGFSSVLMSRSSTMTGLRC